MYQTRYFECFLDTLSRGVASEGTQGAHSPIITSHVQYLPSKKEIQTDSRYVSTISKNYLAKPKQIVVTTNLALLSSKKQYLRRAGKHVVKVLNEFNIQSSIHRFKHLNASEKIVTLKTNLIKRDLQTN